MSDQLNRIKMLIGNDAMRKLQNATVMIVGCGAVGSFAIEALARCGIGHIILVDFDVIEESNINRQIFALHSTIKHKKVDIARERIADINQDIKVTIFDTFFDENTTLPVQPDFVIDAIDTLQSKIALYRWCQKNDIPFISSMGAARKTDPSKIRIDKLSKTFACPLAARIRKIVRDERLPDFSVVFSTETPVGEIAPDKNFGSIITVTGTFGLYAANYAIKFLITH
ncbi:MAG: tRNA threonylcarbamoyladenosine dehydratase [Alphaproteobacteria bacterium]|nr:tRNA threonylcarbamoyladenosine dehydratase [Alphaproteobacteria bacterium]